ncbi:hypothetical protein P7K49_016296 [Saguinus oedipus]|uniref:Uncharacterized protein n=1 Tax=Saguinus oedipus TaxID=9490 RepID=A0ABQ9VC42_SAGOE|nr:hypothetical protein P7K49_016296 [Saguinus oedipus]
MNGVWGAGGPRCQEALAVLSSLCRARPPPLGLDVETCRSFELQPPERSPSASGAGGGVGEGMRVSRRPSPTPLAPITRSLGPSRTRTQGRCATERAPLADFAKRAPPARAARTLRQTQPQAAAEPRREPEPIPSPIPAGLDPGAQLRRLPGVATAGMASAGGSARWRPAPGIYLLHQCPVATVAGRREASLSGRLEGPGREGVRGRVPFVGEGLGE